MIEILSKHFKEGEASKVEKEIEKDTSFKEIYERIKSDPDYRMSVLEEKIDKIDDTFDKRFEAFKKAVLEAEKVKSPADKIKQEIEEKLNAKKEEVMKALKEKADKALPFGIGSGLFDWASDLIKGGESKDKGFLGNMFSKIGAGVGIFILGLLGLKEGYESLSKVKLESKEEEKKDKIPLKPAVPLEKTESDKDVIKKKIDKYNKLGSIVLKEMGDEKFTSEDNFYTILGVIEQKGLSYSEINNLTYDEKLFGKITKEEFEKVKKSILSSSLNIFYDSLLTEINIGKLQKNEKANKLLIELGVTNYKDGDWKLLEINKLNSLMGMIVFSMSIISLKGFGANIEGLFSKIVDFTNDNNLSSLKEGLDEELDSFEKEIMPNDLSANIFSNRLFGENSSFDITKEKFLENLSTKDSIYIDKLLNFRDFVKNKIINNERYNLGEGEKILKKISVKDVLQLYFSFKGEIPVDNEIDNNFHSATIYLWIFNILSRGGDQGLYIDKLGKEILNKGDKKVEEKDRPLLKIITKKIIDKSYLESKLEHLSVVKDVAIENVKNNKEIALWIGGIALVLSFTPAGKVGKVLYSLLGKKGIALLASAGVFSYFYSQLDEDNKGKIKSCKDELKEILGIDIDEYL